MKKILTILTMVLVGMFAFTGCFYTDDATEQDIENTFEVGKELADNQPTPTDIEYSLERYNLIRRAYWVNGQREKAIALPCPITKPLGYIILITEGGAILGRFIVDGKVSSLNSWLTPDYYYDWINGQIDWEEVEMPDIDGTYGTNDDGIFFFTPDGKYLEWTGTYLYSDIPFVISNPVLEIEGE
jgi:hypothetical protein